MNNSKTKPNVSLFLAASLPYAGFLLVVCGYSLLYFFKMSVPRETVALKQIILVYMILTFGGLCLLIHFFILYKGPKEVRYRALSTLIFSAILFILCGIVSEKFFPVSSSQHSKLSKHKYSPFQLKLQRLLKRRLTERLSKRRGVFMYERYNSLGWPDKERSFEKKGKRIVCIGDSFLEVRSSKNLPERLELMLQSTKEHIEVLNLSLAETSPEDYRFRFYEFALDYQPDHVLLFIYGGNDAMPYYTYTPYEHNPFSVSVQAVMFLSAIKAIPKKVILQLSGLMKNQTRFKNRQDFFKHLGQVNISRSDMQFVYLVVNAYSVPLMEKPFPFSTIAPNTLTRLALLWHQNFTINAGLKKTNEDSDKEPEMPTWKDLQSKFNKVFALAKEKRLESISKLAAEYNRMTDYSLFLEKLENQDPRFLEELISEPDVTYLLWAALSKSVLNKPEYPVPSKAVIDRATYNYMLYFQEMKNEADRLGVQFSVVLIPEASLGDDDFYRFWLPLIDFRKYFSIRNAVFSKLAVNLKTVSPVINLLDDPQDRLFEGYWHFDGHWNEKGNKNVAETLYAYLTSPALYENAEKAMEDDWGKCFPDQPSVGIMEIFWKEGIQTFHEERKGSLSLKGSLGKEPVLIDLIFPIDANVSELRIDFPGLKGCDYIIEQVVVDTPGRSFYISPQELTLGCKNDVHISGNRFSVTGTDPYLCFTAPGGRAKVLSVNVKGICLINSPGQLGKNGSR